MKDFRLVNVLIFLILFISIKFTISIFSSNTFNKITLSGVFPQSGEGNVFWAKNFHGFSELNTTSFDVVGKKVSQNISTILSNKEIFHLQIHLPEGDIKLETIALEGFFQKHIFAVDTAVVAQQQLIKIQSRKDPISQSHIFEVRNIRPQQTLFLGYVLPFFLALIMQALLKTTHFRGWLVFRDLKSSTSIRSQKNLYALDGLRGIAAIMVLLEHTAAEFLGLGRAGVWLFFVLSGFLLSRSFVLEPQKIFTLDGIAEYLKRRIKRILPMFYFLITILMLVQGDIPNAVRHYLLIQGDGHFWTILHEVYFYIFLPVLALLCYALFKQNTVLSIIFLLLASWGYHVYADADFISIYGLGIRHAPFFEVFIIGMAAGYFYYGFFQKKEVLKLFCLKWEYLISAVSLFALFLFSFFASSLKVIQESFDVLDKSFFSAVLCSLIILASAISSNHSWLNRCLSLSLFRLVGIVGYSFYLIHPYAIAIFDNMFIYFFAISANQILPSLAQFFATFILTLVISLFTYTFIERPFLIRK